MLTFRQRIQESINNEILQKALDANTERRLKGRALAFESLPDWRERRQRAHAIRECRHGARVGAAGQSGRVGGRGTEVHAAV